MIFKSKKTIPAAVANPGGGQLADGADVTDESEDDALTNPFTFVPKKIT